VVVAGQPRHLPDPGNEEQWTLSVQHDDADVDRYVEVFAAFCTALAA
jgi:glutamate-1-semialdehyde 2,1-aminomutase